MDGIKLFNDESTEVSLPSSTIQKDSSFVEDQLGDAIDGTVVQRVLIHTRNVIDEQNYVMDFSNVQLITVFQKEALKGLLYKRKKKTLADSIEQPDEKAQLVTLYMYKKGKDVVELGKGDKYHLDKAIPLLKKYVFDNEIEVYKNFNPSQHVAEVVSEQMISYRLNL